MQLIHSDPNVDPNGCHVIQALVSDEACRSARYFREISSTNTAAMNDLLEGGFAIEALPRLYLTDCQTAGRGRLGRQWISDETTLTFSIMLSTTNFQGASHLLSLATGVGVARAIEHCFAPFRVKLKWPNDVYLSGGKVAGILVEATQNVPQQRVIGIGINVGSSPILVDHPDAPPVTSLAIATGRPLSRYEFLEPVIKSVLGSISEMNEDPTSVLDGFRSRCMLTNESIRLSMGANDIAGFCRGVTDEGELMMETESGQQIIRSGEANLIRRAPMRH